MDSKPAVTDPDAPGVSAPELQLPVTAKLWKSNFYYRNNLFVQSLPEHIYNPIMAMVFSAMLTFQLDNNKK